MSKKISITDLKQDSRNANKGNEAGAKKLKSSISKLGIGRGILVDKDNNIIAGNHVVQEAIAQGYENVIIVPTDGKTLVVTQRTDVAIDSKKGRELAISDNVTAKEGIEFDFDTLDDIMTEFDIDVEFMPEVKILGQGMSNEELDRFFEESEDNGKAPKQKIILEYTDDEYELVINAFSFLKGSKEQIVFKLLGL
jgi:hypothetical protein